MVVMCVCFCGGSDLGGLVVCSCRIGGDVSTPLSPPVVDLAKRPLVRKPAISRPVSNSVSENVSRRHD